MNKAKPAPRFVLVVEPGPGIDAVRALRRGLKGLLRQQGLKCVDLREVQHRGVRPMDMTKWSNNSFLKTDDVRDQPRKEQIVGIKPPGENDKYPKPTAIFKSGKMVGLNKISVGALMVEFGAESDDWVDIYVEVRLETLDLSNGPVEMIVVRPLNNATSQSNSAKPKAQKAPIARPSSADMDDEIPF
jgi:hypothetical protein